MEWLYLLLILPLFLTTALSIVFLLYILGNRQSAGAAQFAVLMGIIAIWAFVYALEVVTWQPEMKLLWLKVRLSCMAVVPLTVWTFGRRYDPSLLLNSRPDTQNPSTLTQISGWLQRLSWLFTLEPLIFLVLLWTNERHGWVWNSAEVILLAKVSLIQIGYGLALYFHLLFSYLLVIPAIFWMLRAFQTTLMPFRLVSFAVLLSILCPWIANIVEILQPVGIAPLNWSIYALSITCMIILWAFIRYNFLDILPVARYTIIESLDDAVIITDHRDRILYANQAAGNLVGRSPDHLTGHDLDWSQLPGNAGATAQNLVKQTGDYTDVVTQGEGAERRWYDLRIAQLADPVGRSVGRVITWHDSTQAQKLIEQANDNLIKRQLSEVALVRQVKELSALHAVSLASLESADENELIERTTRIIGEALFPESFGLLLLDNTAKVLRKHPSYRTSKPTPDTVPLGQGLISEAALEGKSIRTGNVTQEPGYKEVDPDTRSEMCVPLSAGARVIGVLNAESHQPNAFSIEDERLLTTLAIQLSTAIERVRAEAAVRQRIQELLAISRIGREINSVLDRGQILETIVRFAAQIANAGASGLFQIQNGRLYLVAAYGVGAPFIEGTNLNGLALDSRTAVGETAITGHPVQYRLSELPEGDLRQETLTMENLQSGLAVPMMRGSDPIGAIVIWQREIYFFSQEEEMFLQALAHQCVSAIENARQFENERELRRIAEVLQETGSVLSATLDVDTLLDTLLVQVERLVPYDAANFIFISGDTGRVARSRGYEKFGEALVRSVNSLYLSIPSLSNLRWMIENKQPCIVSDTTSNPDWIHIGEQYPLNSWIGAPVIYQGKVVALFSLDSVTPNFYQPEHAERLSLIAGQASLALQNARLFEETQQRLREVTLLSKIIEAGAGISDLPSSLQRVCDEIAGFFDTPDVLFGLFNDIQPGLEIISTATHSPLRSALGMVLGLHPSHPLYQRLARARGAVVFHQINSSTLLKEFASIFHETEVEALILSPLQGGDRLIGLFIVGMPAMRRIRAGDSALVQDIARQIGQAIERRDLFQAIRQHADHMAMLAELSEKLNQPLSRNDVISEMGRGAMALGKADRGAVYVRSSESSAYCAWFVGLSADYVVHVTEELNTVPGGQLLTSTEPVLIPDMTALPGGNHLRRLAETEGYRSLGLWPLVYQGYVVAALGLYYDRPYQITDMERETLLAFTRQAAIAIQNASLFEETHRRAAQQEALNHIIAAAVTAPEISVLMETALDLTLEAVGVEIGGIRIGDHIASRGLSDSVYRSDGVDRSNGQIFAAGISSPPGIFSPHSPTGRRLSKVPMTQIVRDLNDVAPDAPLAALKDRLAPTQVRAALIVPLMAAGQVIGELAMATQMQRNWLPEEVALVETIGRQIGSAAERLELLAQTQEQARQVQRIIDTVPEGVLVLDPEYRIVRANPVAEDLLTTLLDPEKSNAGLPLTELGGYPVTAILGSESEKTWNEWVIPSNPPAILEIASRRLGAELGAVGWVVVLRDVTRERDNLARIQMQERLATVGQLAAGIAHDFNNIMAAVVVYADLLSLQPNLTPNSREQITIIQQQVQRATSLIRQILDFSRRGVIEPNPLELLTFVKEFSKLLRRILPETISIHTSFDSDAFLVKADPIRLQQALMNLALNARDAMPEGGDLQIQLDHFELASEDQAPLPDLVSGRWIRLMVEDNGTGVAPEHLPFIFDPFFTTKAVGKGTGLGLSQVYGIVKQHGGCIDVQSQVGEGSIFIIYLPELTTSEAPIGGHDLIRHIPEMHETILLVEDDQAARSAIQSLMENQGLTVLCAENGGKAIDLFNQVNGEVDLVISDIVMPEMGGIELYDRLQSIQPGIKFLFITGHPLDSKDQELLEDLHLPRLLKPFSVQDLLVTLRTLLDHQA